MNFYMQPPSIPDRGGGSSTSWPEGAEAASDSIAKLRPLPGGAVPTSRDARLRTTSLDWRGGPTALSSPPRAPCHRLSYSPLSVLAVDRVGRTREAGVLVLTCPGGLMLAWEIVVGRARSSMRRTLSDLLAAMPRSSQAVACLLVDPRLDFREVERTTEGLGIRAWRSSVDPVPNGLPAVADAAERLLEAEADPQGPDRARGGVPPCWNTQAGASSSPPTTRRRAVPPCHYEMLDPADGGRGRARTSALRSRPNWLTRTGRDLRERRTKSPTPG